MRLGYFFVVGAASVCRAVAPRRSFLLRGLGIVGGAPGGRHRASPIHRQRARAAWMSSIVTVLELVGGAPAQGWGETRVAVLAARKTLASPFDRFGTGAAMQVVWQMEP